ncbi:hypothetical protein Gasu2_47900 [Galdieria sulphuraria]|uniref:Rubredoxin family protein n=1 Tax=Galdieria sulphuraria TaxID=130081 RepID=M2XU35_GALSU|nr:rubredoxin family protein [Galdieria sulphuraria]EME26924.1 rubredoxin family protein [Galdieria sulphuraria]GJD10610.1 hypothetical protein Gasu2_47900 [Galdieria sulphuraria]|eukprot:XP_005703444.1 rubredoxin family protein [Galdieria sulphuraria]
MDVASFVVTPTSSQLILTNRKYFYVPSISCRGCIYATRKNSANRTAILPNNQISNQYYYFVGYQRSKSNHLLKNQRFVCRKDWTSGSIHVEKASFTPCFIFSPNIEFHTSHSRNSLQILSEQDGFSSEEKERSQSSTHHSSSSISSSNNNNNNSFPKPRMPRAVAKARAEGEPVVFVEGKWVCMDCGYVYPDDASIAFENLPDNWRCPLCGSPKRRFFKKQGNKVVARMSDDRWMIAVALGFSIALVWFGYWAIHNL